MPAVWHRSDEDFYYHNKDVQINLICRELHLFENNSKTDVFYDIKDVSMMNEMFLKSLREDDYDIQIGYRVLIICTDKSNIMQTLKLALAVGLALTAYAQITKERYST